MQTNTKTDPIVTKYHEALELSVDFVSDYFELAARLYKLWRGYLPEQLDGTFSKIMVNSAHAITQDRIPKLAENILARPPSLEAASPVDEFYVEQAQNWLRYMMDSPDKLDYKANIIHTLQSACIMGTGYRMPCVRHFKNDAGKMEEILTVKDIDFFQILPSANGGLINPQDRWAEDAVQYFFHVDWMTDEQLKAYDQYEGFRNDEAAKLFKSATESDAQIDSSLYDKYKIIAGVSYGPERQHYRRKMNDIEGKDGKRRVVFWYGRDFMRVIVQDMFCIYDGPNPLGNGLLPLVKYCVTPDLKEWFGVSGLEMAEDIIIAKILNFNFRMDHLTRVMFPTKFIRDDIRDGRPESDFYDRPYAVHFFRDRTDIREALFYDRAPEITPQSFVEEDRMMSALQEILGLPNYSRGMSGEGTLANETAYGIGSLIKQAQGRLGMESMQLEYNGLAQECRLLLAMGAKYITEDQPIKLENAKDGFRWTTISPEVLAGRYVVRTHGTRYLEQQESAFQKVLALYPLWNNNPLINQEELNKQTLQVVDVFHNQNKLLAAPQPPMGMPPEQAQGASPRSAVPGGHTSVLSATNTANSVRDRNTVQPVTGNLVPATFQM